MKNKKIINAWDKMKPSEEIKNQIFSDISAGRRRIRKNFRRARNILIAACAAAMLFMLSAFGTIPRFGEIIETLIFDVFNVNKVDTLTAEDGTKLTASYTFIPDGKIKSNGIWLEKYFDTFEEAEEYMNFNPRGLNYIAEGFSFRNILVYRDISCLVYYEKIDGALFSLSQQYVGENAEIRIATINDIEKIIIHGDIEALLQTYDSGYELMWIKDGIGYSLSHQDKDELIKMVESVE